MAASVDGGWRVLRLAATRIWFPEAAAGAVVVERTTHRGLEPSEADGWEAAAILPRARWGPVAVADHPAATADGEFRTDRDIALLEPDPDADRRPPDLHLARLGVVDHYFGVSRDAPGQPALTVRADGRHLGLHLDNWDRLPAGERHASRNRVNLNLGSEARWFLFADLDVVAAHEADAVPTTVSSRELVHRSTTSVPVLRVLIPPGWAYIAPTENLLHDASSEGQRQGTVHVSALGRFTPPPIRCSRSS